MILNFDDLPALRGKVTMVDGGFDPLHFGHVLYFRAAAEQGLPVLCNVSSDTYVGAKHKVLLPLDVRSKVIDEFRSISYVHPSDRTTAEVLDQLQPKKFVKGSQWKGKLPPEESTICERSGTEIVFVDTPMDSSSRRLSSYLAGDLAEKMAGYEALVLTQAPPDAEDFDPSYFHSDWRRDTSGNYTVEQRRRLEGRNPELIRDTFQPATVLDFGCGPGALMYLLNELGVKADGIDFAAASKTLAPEAVRDRIQIASVVDVDIPSNSYELVICREVLEHLTVLQVQKAVQNMCRISSRYTYVTTRFHPNPNALFDVTTEFDIDPTHITLMHIEMLRLMFTLQGMKRRPDLEACMDWLNKGRVLVYEKN
jgi:glycerol-3-phosphate cytidylyltransferase-like family protein/SAM-dependent methyltransferase